MSALSAMQDKNTHLENSLSAETRIKLDLFKALGEAKRQIDLMKGKCFQGLSPPTIIRKKNFVFNCSFLHNSTAVDIFGSIILTNIMVFKVNHEHQCRDVLLSCLNWLLYQNYFCHSFLRLNAEIKCTNDKMMIQCYIKTILVFSSQIYFRRETKSAQT